MLSKVLVIRFSSIGDIVLTSPVVRCIHQQWEGPVEIHYLTKKVHAALIESNPHVHKVWYIEDNLREVLPELKQETFDYVFDLHGNWRTGRVKSNLPALAFKLNKLNWLKWVRVNLKLDRLPRVHIVDRYLETTKAFGIENDGRGLDHYIAPSDEVDGPGIAGGARYLAVAIGATYGTKCLPAEQIGPRCRSRPGKGCHRLRHAAAHRLSLQAQWRQCRQVAAQWNRRGLPVQ